MSEASAWRVAIVDDNKTRRDSLFFTLEDAGLRPVAIEGASSLTETVRVIHDSADVAVCDHRLSRNAYAPFTGAELVAELYVHGVPAILVTAFQDDVSIRTHRERIPRLLVGDEVGDADMLKVAVEAAIEEVAAKHIPADRQRHRSFIRVEYIEEDEGRKIVYAFVPQWSEESGIRFPLDLIPEAIRDSIIPGTKLLAEVNTGATDVRDVFVADFSLAPEAADDDELA
jgi:CheY-like chemotaxis protein